jgi:hypothetical protein
MGLSYEYAWLFVKCTFRTYNMLLKILPFALHTSPMSVQALQSISCLSYVSYVDEPRRKQVSRVRLRVRWSVTIAGGGAVDIENTASSIAA